MASPADPFSATDLGAAPLCSGSRRITLLLRILAQHPRAPDLDAARRPGVSPSGPAVLRWSAKCRVCRACGRPRHVPRIRWSGLRSVSGVSRTHWVVNCPVCRVRRRPRHVLGGWRARIGDPPPPCSGSPRSETPRRQPLGPDRPALVGECPACRAGSRARHVAQVPSDEDVALRRRGEHGIGAREMRAFWGCGAALLHRVKQRIVAWWTGPSCGCGAALRHRGEHGRGREGSRTSTRGISGTRMAPTPTAAPLGVGLPHPSAPAPAPPASRTPRRRRPASLRVGSPHARAGKLAG